LPAVRGEISFILLSRFQAGFFYPEPEPKRHHFEADVHCGTLALEQEESIFGLVLLDYVKSEFELTTIIEDKIIKEAFPTALPVEIHLYLLMPGRIKV
jgi:hypothetical protein